MKRFDWLHHIEQLDPTTDFLEIYRISVTHEFPWDYNQSLSFALFRTYAVPSIGSLLAGTGELTERVQKRYDDTSLILDAVLEHGFAGPGGRTAIRRMNQMHGAYSISNEDFVYVLSTFVVVPIRWIDRFGWRRLCETEKVASAHYYRELGRHMGMTAIPATYQEFAAYLDAYEAEHFATGTGGTDPGGRAVADATLRLFTTFPPTQHAPAALIRRFALGLMDDALRAALGYPRISRAEQAACAAAVRLRGRVVRFLPPRTEPLYTRQRANIRSYPAGYEIAELGTFPHGCPVARPAPDDATPPVTTA
ncbi:MULTISPECIES: oxygenase MpaB family protein [unclassified Frankia]|uniref:oxygenase MpaB family protein n=1 Tax=unclassified Frankia TaxID=2632575 RepID=UPI002AD5A6B3|nr:MULTISPECIES: oxygenase MpaB family protein [unclassified Frankia]